MLAVLRASCLRALLVGGLMAAASPAAAPAGPAAPPRPALPTQKVLPVENYGNLPLGFVPNTGQAGMRVKFLSGNPGYGVYLTRDEMVLALCKNIFAAERTDLHRASGTISHSGACGVLRMRLEGANRKAHPAGEGRLPGTVNYFMGSNPAKWRTHVPAYSRVRYAGIYSGMDLIYHGDQRRLEFDFSLAPHADPKTIRLRFNGPNHLYLAPNGNLVLTTAEGKVAFRKPLIYQMAGRLRRPVAGYFALLGKGTVGFRLGHYDRSKPLLIDPVLAFSTFLGGAGGEAGNAIAVDAAGDAYVAGHTCSTDFPVTQGAFQTTNPAASTSYHCTAFVTELNPTGTALVYSTYLGGSGGDGANAIAVDASGDVYVTGQTSSTGFPVTPGAFETSNRAAANAASSAFVTELNPTGTALVYSTYLGGSGEPNYPYDRAEGIAVDAAGNAYVAGVTYSVDFPITPGVFQATNHAAGNNEGNAFVAKLNPAGSSLIYSTYLGGSGGNKIGFLGDIANAIAVNADGNAYVTGQAGSSDFPTTPGAYQTTNKAVTNEGANAFVTELNATGTALTYSTYLGGSGGNGGSDMGYAISLDAAGNAYVAGQAASADFPVTGGAFQTTNHGAAHNDSNAFVAKLNPSGTALVYSTYLGGSGGVVALSPTLYKTGGDSASDLAIDSSSDAFVTGSTASSDFPITRDAYQAANNDQCSTGCIGGYNAFVTELNPTGTAILYSTYLGGGGINPLDFVGVLVFGEGDQANGLALGNSANVYITGSANSYDFPLTSGAFQTALTASNGNAFIAKLNISATASPVSPTVTVTPASSTITSGETLQVVVSVSGTNGNPTSTGTLTLASGTYDSAATTLSGGSVTIDIPSGSLLPDGGLACGYPPSPDMLLANYVPDAGSSSSFKSSSGMGSVEVVAPCISPTPGLTTISSAQAQTQPFSVTIAATGGTGEPVPTGTITLTTGAYASAATPLSAGSATIIIPAGILIAGSNTLDIGYSGDSSYARFPLAALAMVIVTSGPGTPSFTITGTPVTINPGATTGNTSAITVTSVGGFKGTVALSAAVTSAPAGAQYPPTFSITSYVYPIVVGVNPGTATLTITTTASGVCTQASGTPFGGGGYAGEAALACILLLGIPGSRRRRWAVLRLLLLFLVAGSLLACGGGGRSTPPCNGTTPGTYTVTITGTSGPTAATGTVTLTVL